MTTTTLPIRSTRRRWTPRRALVLIVITIAALLALASFVSPLLYTLIGSVTPSRDAGDQGMFPSFDNYVRVFESGFPRFFLNSLIITVITVIATLLLSAMVAYPLSFFRFRTRRPIEALFMLGLMIPYQVVLLPLFLTYAKTDLLNTYWSVIIPMVAFGMPFSVFLLLRFFRELDEGIIEAAVIDGASAGRIFWTIILPLSRNVLITIAILRAIFAWNEYLFAYTFISSRNNLTLVLGLNDFIGAEGLVDWGPMFSAIAFSVLPALLAYILLNKYMIAGLADGATKE
ncbi:carbohydrate ABC transporter permease [Microbacterium maritypicum]|uniref:ABC transmembrane type-1 domain-containing protein n=1 Tax=Microbacterium maritypicum MF109 TaxID=1333857 RepID=T5KJ66_MICMQ|nr:carbohydrate ABC transporter permease [Microbacterium liquefaciens]EQM74783.1 hypothetical protein L687_04820 [Microbacterium maritypicum MF109]